MAISEVMQCSAEAQNYLVWKHPEENFNTTSQLIVDPTHEALLVLNGNAADLFGEGRHTLTTSNIPLLRKIIEIPTGGKTAFPCKVYFVNKVHQMDLLWGTKDAIPLEDPLYDIFLHVMIHGSLSYSIVDSRKFLLKLAGLRDKFTPEMLVAKFRGIIAKHVKDCVSKIMINGKLSYFMISANLLEISEVLQERIGEIFDEYGMEIEFFNVESISVPKEDYDAVSDAKERRTSRLIEGYTWQEERQMMIAEKFAGNEGTMGALGGMMGGAMGGMVMGSTISEVARNALSFDRIPTTPSPKDVSGIAPTKGVNSLNGMSPFDVSGFMKNPTSSSEQGTRPSTPSDGGNKKFCVECGNPLSPGAKFCPECGHKVENNACPGCGNAIKPGMKFCPECGFDLR